MTFEYDDSKNYQNQLKHKVSFEQALEIWQDPNMVVLHARNKGENRLMAIGKLHAICYSIIHVNRNKVIRIISARTSTKKEVKLYENARKNR